MAPRSTKQKTSDHQAMTREIQRRSFLWRTLSESGAGYILNNLHWEYDIIWPINMDISNIKSLLNGVIWQNINYFMILSTIYWSNMSQRMRLLPEMLTGTLLSAEDSTCFPLRPLGVSWVPWVPWFFFQAAATGQLRCGWCRVATGITRAWRAMCVAAPSSTCQVWTNRERTGASRPGKGLLMWSMCQNRWASTKGRWFDTNTHSE